VLVGDRASDLEAARRAGVRGLLFPGGNLAEFLRRNGLPQSATKSDGVV
jgi:D-glycero-D-manno-heptose 1,7-bisphosphate phosphatase